MVHNKLKCFALAGLSSPIKCLRVRPGAYPRVKHLKRTYLLRLRPYSQTLSYNGKTCHGQALQLITNIRKLQQQKVL
jgi:hypothetical protein